MTSTIQTLLANVETALSALKDELAKTTAETDTDTIAGPAFLGKIVGKRGKNNIYLPGGNPSSLYELDGINPVPRGFNVDYELLAYIQQKPVGPNSANYGNNVPASYTLPSGWGWMQYPDKAYYIVPRSTDTAPPDYLTKTDTNTSGTKPAAGGAMNDEYPETT